MKIDKFNGNCSHLCSKKSVSKFKLQSRSSLNLFALFVADSDDVFPIIRLGGHEENVGGCHSLTPGCLYIFLQPPCSVKFDEICSACFESTSKVTQLVDAFRGSDKLLIRGPIMAMAATGADAVKFSPAFLLQVADGCT